MAFVRPDELRDAEAAQCARGRQVRVQGIGVDRDVLDVVRPRRREAGLLRHARADVGVGAAVPPDLAVARDDATVLADPALDAERARVLGDGEELLLHRQRNFDRFFYDQRQNTDEGFELDIELRAKAAAEERHAHADAVLRPAEQARDLDAHERGALRSGVDDEGALGRLGDRHQRLEWRVHHLLRAEAVLEDAVRALHRFFRISSSQPEIQGDIGVLPALEMLQVREGAGGPELVVHHRLRGHCFDFVVDGRQLLVLRRDQVYRLLRHMRIGSEHDRDRLADIAHLVQGEYWLIVECRPVVRFRNDFLDVLPGHHAVDTRQRLRRAHVDALDAAVRDAGAENLAVKHPRQAQVVDVLGLARDLEPRLQARYRAPDLRRLSGLRCALHSRAPRASATARFR